jgi:hypothetical protein
MATFVSQAAGNSGTTANTSQALSGPTAPATFAVLLVGRSGGLATGALTGVTDTSSNTWTMATRGAVSGVSFTRVELWYCQNYTPATTVTFTSGTSQTNGWNILGFSGLASSGAFDVASPDNSASAAATTYSTPTITSTATGLVIAAGQHPTTGGAAPSSPWTALTSWTVNTTGGAGQAAYQNAAAGSYSATFTQTGTTAAGVVIAAFKDAAVVTRQRTVPSMTAARRRAFTW